MPTQAAFRNHSTLGGRIEQGQVTAGQQACFLIHGQTFQEINWFKPEYGSWFVGDMVVKGMSDDFLLAQTCFAMQFRCDFSVISEV